MVLNYNTGVVDIVRNVPDDITPEFVYDKLGYHESEVAWMATDDNNFDTYRYYPSLDKKLEEYDKIWLM